MVNAMGKGWKSKLPEALWAYRMAYKMPIGMTPYHLVYGKTCHKLVDTVSYQSVFCKPFDKPIVPRVICFSNPSPWH